MQAVLGRGLFPERESSSFTINDSLWTLWTECWDRDTKKRPTAVQVLDRTIQMDSSKPVNTSDENIEAVDAGSESMTINAN